MQPRARFPEQRRAVEPRWLVILSFAVLGCQTMADLEVDYVDCLDPPYPYQEVFDGDGQRPMQQYLEERCWRIEDGSVKSDDSDIKLEATDNEAPAASWQDDPPRVVRTVEGDFLIVTRAEVATGGAGDFCNLRANEDTAGILVRSTGKRATSLAAITLEPHYDEDANPDEDCQDGAETPPGAWGHALALDRAFAEDLFFGEDGEGEVAICRRGVNLYFFYFDREDDSWVSIRSEDEDAPGDFSVIGNDPVDVGLVTTLSANGSEQGVQGTFNWVVLDAGDDAVAECRSALEEFSPPEDI